MRPVLDLGQVHGTVRVEGIVQGRVTPPSSVAPIPADATIAPLSTALVGLPLIGVLLGDARHGDPLELPVEGGDLRQAHRIACEASVGVAHEVFRDGLGEVGSPGIAHAPLGLQVQRVRGSQRDSAEDAGHAGGRGMVGSKNGLRWRLSEGVEVAVGLCRESGVAGQRDDPHGSEVADLHLVVWGEPYPRSCVNPA